MKEGNLIGFDVDLARDRSRLGLILCGSLLRGTGNPYAPVREV